MSEGMSGAIGAAGLRFGAQVQGPDLSRRVQEAMRGNLVCGIWWRQDNLKWDKWVGRVNFMNSEGKVKKVLFDWTIIESKINSASLFLHWSSSSAAKDQLAWQNHAPVQKIKVQ
jgi:hypothetical protein